MIGYAKPGRLKVVTKRMFAQQWDDLGNGNTLIMANHPGYKVMPVSCVLSMPASQVATFSVDAIQPGITLRLMAGRQGQDAIMDFDNSGTFMNYDNLVIQKTVNALWFNNNQFTPLDEASGMLQAYVYLDSTANPLFTYSEGNTNQYLNFTVAYYLIPNY